MRAAYLIKIPPSASIIWAIVKNFIQEETLKRMFIVDGETVGPLFNSTNPSQIEKKFGGTQENITQFWYVFAYKGLSEKFLSSKIHIISTNRSSLN